MKKNTKPSKKEIVKMLLNQDITLENEDDLIDLLIDNSIAVDVDKLAAQTATWKDKLADKITQIAGSWGFIIGFTFFIIIWMLLNVFIFKNLDPYPFILLNLLLSCIAALQAPIIMMSQNRESKKDSLRSKNDYKTDLKSELILEDLYDQLDELQENQRKILELLDKINNQK